MKSALSLLALTLGMTFAHPARCEPDPNPPPSEQTANIDRLHAQAKAAWDASRWNDAETLFRQILSLTESAPGGDSLSVATALDRLATALVQRAHYSEAEALIIRALIIRERALGPADVAVAQTIDDLALIFEAQGRSIEAEPLLRRAFAILNTAVGPEHPKIAQTLRHLAKVARRLGRYGEAESLLRRALGVYKGANVPDEEAKSLDELATTLSLQGRHAEADPLSRQALAIRERAFGPDHPETAESIHTIALSFIKQGRHLEAEALLRRSLAVRERHFGPEHPETAAALSALASAYDGQGRHAEAEPLHARTLAVVERTLCCDSDATAAALIKLALNLVHQNRHAEAEPLARRALAVLEKSLGPQHPDTAAGLDSVALSFAGQGRYSEAEALHRRAVAVREISLGADHPETAAGLETFASFLLQRRRPVEALAPARRAMAALRAAPLRQDDSGRRLTNAALEKAALTLVRAAFEAAQFAGQSPEALRAEAFEAAQFIRSSAAAESLSRSAARVAAGINGLDDLARHLERALAERAALDRQIIAAAGMADQNAPALRDALSQRRAALDHDVARVEEEMRTRFPAYFDLKSPDAPSLAALQARVGPDAALLRDDEAFIVLTTGNAETPGFIFAVTKDGGAWAEIGAPDDRIAADVARLRASLDPSGATRAPDAGAAERTAGTGGYDRDTAKKLHDAFFGAPRIAALIATKPKWILLPQGALIGVPFSVLVARTPEPSDDSDPQALRRTAWLGLERALSIAPSAASLRTLRLFPRPAAAAGSPFFGIGDPAFEGPPGPSRGAGTATEQIRKLFRLPGTGDEIRSIAASLGAGPESYVLGEAARETAVRDGRLERARIVVIASHALMAGDLSGTVVEPALALTPPPTPSDSDDDGLLTAREMMRLKMSAELVVISACDSLGAPSNSAQPTSFAQALFYAGAGRVLAAQWRVNDKAASRLTSRMMALAQTYPDLGLSGALQASMRELMNDESQDALGSSFAHPETWAPFVLLGVD